MLPKRKSRPITVQGNRFRYVISQSWKDDGWFDFNITVQSELHNGSKLFVKGLVTRNFWLDVPNPKPDSNAYLVLTPGHIGNYINQGIDEGWLYDQSAQDHEITVTSPTKS